MGQKNKTPSFDGVTLYPFRVFHHFITALNNTDIAKLTTAPSIVSTIVLTTSGLLIFANRMVNAPPTVVAFVCVGSLIFIS